MTNELETIVERLVSVVERMIGVCEVFATKVDHMDHKYTSEITGIKNDLTKLKCELPKEDKKAYMITMKDIWRFTIHFNDGTVFTDCSDSNHIKKIEFEDEVKIWMCNYHMNTALLAKILDILYDKDYQKTMFDNTGSEIIVSKR